MTMSQPELSYKLIHKSSQFVKWSKSWNLTWATKIRLCQHIVYFIEKTGNITGKTYFLDLQDLAFQMSDCSMYNSEDFWCKHIPLMFAIDSYESNLLWSWSRKKGLHCTMTSMLWYVAGIVMRLLILFSIFFCKNVKVTW